MLREAGHEATHIRDIGLGNATDATVDQFAQDNRLVLITRDLDFCDTRIYPPETSAGRVVMRVPDTYIAKDIAELLSRFLTMTDLVNRIPGRLVVIDLNRVRFRPALEVLK